ncbi:YbiU family protein, partial [Salmonella enterica]|uniref:YbiU family protein n=1 Tax=Salmonella enterica TaxID=28901 RepID=UPI00398C5AD9
KWGGVFATVEGVARPSVLLPGQGVLHVVPSPEGMAYILLRALLEDVPEDELCGVAPGRVLPIAEQWHPLLMAAFTSIPPLEAGDSVWWHCDCILSVDPVETQQVWGQVLSLPSSPMWDQTVAYAYEVHSAR